MYVVLCFLLGIILGVPVWAEVPVNLSGINLGGTTFDASSHNFYTNSTLERVLHQLELIPLPEPIDFIPPKLELTGPAHMTLHVGEKYREPGFIAIDAVDGDRTEHVQV